MCTIISIYIWRTWMEWRERGEVMDGCVSQEVDYFSSFMFIVGGLISWPHWPSILYTKHAQYITMIVGICSFLLPLLFYCSLCVTCNTNIWLLAYNIFVYVFVLYCSELHMNFTKVFLKWWPLPALWLIQTEGMILLGRVSTSFCNWDARTYFYVIYI